MSRSLEPALLSLLPSLPDASSLPQPLLDLASSLLAQSRHNASTLKAEEEIARGYACAHIACERLKTSLDLPDLSVRPPVKPRLYQRLYTHLDHILPASSVGRSGRIRTPSGKARDAGIFGSGSASVQRTRERGTPSKEAALAQFRARGDGTPSKTPGTAVGSTPGKSRPTRDTLPLWIRPTIQSLCAELDGERIGRTVLAGMQTIVVPHGRRSKDEWINTHLTPLLAAVYFMVSIRVSILVTGEQVNTEQYAVLRRKIVAAVKSAREQVQRKDVDEEVLWDGWGTITLKGVDEAAKQIGENKWQEEDWFTGIDDLVAYSGSGGNADVEMEDVEDGVSRAKVQIQRGDTMLQNRWVMTDEKRKEYRAWKAGIMKRVEEIERSGGASMDVDVSAWRLC